MQCIGSMHGVCSTFEDCRRAGPAYFHVPHRPFWLMHCTPCWTFFTSSKLLPRCLYLIVFVHWSAIQPQGCFLACGTIQPTHCTPHLPSSHRSLPCVCVLLCLQDRIRALERDLRAISSPVGPFNQRIAHYFAEALSSRARGDGILKYATDIPRDREVSE